MATNQLYDLDAPSLSGVEQSVYESVEHGRAWEFVTELADLDRVSGSDDEQAAANAITSALDKGGVDHHRYEPELFLSIPREATVQSVNGDGLDLASAKTVSFSRDGTVSGEVVRLTSDETGDSVESLLDHSLGIADVDVKDRIVVAESLIPIKEIKQLERRGAAAFIAIHPHEKEPHEGIITPIWGGAPTYEQRDAIPDIVVANISAADGQRFDEFLAQHESPTVEISCDVDTGWSRCPIVEARIDTPNETDEFVLMHGHYDSWHVGVTDNATGAAALLESALVLKEHASSLKRDIRIVWWPGHSTGRYAGSTWYADEFALDLADHCVAHVNVDSPGVAGATEYVSRVKWMTAAEDVASETIADVTGKSTTTRRPSRAGDYSFNNLGIPGLSLQSSIPEAVREERGYHLVGGSGGHADAWHLSTDTLDKADPNVLQRDIQVYLLATYRLATQEPVPLDYRQTIAEHQHTLAELADVVSTADANLDLESLREEYAQLADVVDRLYERDDLSYTEHLQALSRSLTRINYVTEAPFAQDPAVGRPPFPSLDHLRNLPTYEGDDRRFAELQTKRTINAIRAEIRALTSQVQNTIDAA